MGKEVLAVKADFEPLIITTMTKFNKKDSVILLKIVIIKF